jgi:hypothetical protein
MKMEFSKRLKINGIIYDRCVYQCPTCGQKHEISDDGKERAEESGQLTLPCSNQIVMLDKES